MVVVNLRRRADRLERFGRSAARALGIGSGSGGGSGGNSGADDVGAAWSRFEAVDGATEAAARDPAFSVDWDASRNAAHDRNVAPGPRRATAGERGCALSHVALWREIAARGGGSH